MVARLSDRLIEETPGIVPLPMGMKGKRPDPADPMMSDVIFTADAIAKFLGWTNRKTYFQLQHGMLPCAKHANGEWYTSKAALVKHFAIG
jgi:hypothetical protein